jgi:hypothetical protein
VERIFNAMERFMAKDEKIAIRETVNCLISIKR